MTQTGPLTDTRGRRNTSSTSNDTLIIIQNTDISHVEDASAEAADAGVHEVDDTSIVKQVIQEIAYAPAEDEAPGNDGKRRYLFGNE